MQVGSRKLNLYFQLSKCWLETLNVIGFVKPTIRETRQGKSFSFSRLSEVPVFNQGPRLGLTWVRIPTCSRSLILRVRLWSGDTRVTLLIRRWSLYVGADAELRHLRELKHGEV